MSTETTTTETRPDHEIARDELGALFQSLQLEGKCALLGRRKEDGWDHFAWNVTITRRGNGPDKVTDIPYKCGLAHVYPQSKAEKSLRITPRAKAPSPAEVLACITREVEDAKQPFEDWAADFGYDADSRKAEQLYHQCRAEARHLSALGLSPEDRAKLAELSARL